MAELIHSPTGSGPINFFEQQLIQLLLATLPDGYAVLPNFSLRDQFGRAYEYDAVVLTPHAIYVLEAKAWYGRLTGDDTEWLLNGKPRKCPLWLADQKGKVLKARIGMAHGLWVEPLLVVPNGIINELGGNWYRSVVPLSRVAEILTDPRSAKYPSPTSLDHRSILKALLGHWLARREDRPRLFGSYEVVETLAQDSESGEFLARHAVLGGGDRFRIRSWTLDPYLYSDPEARKRREAVIRRPAEAIGLIGRHQNLLPVIAFDYDDDSHEFYEVTEWSVFGTLHGYLRHSDRQEQLTLRERLEIAAGVARALEAVHALGLVHRNVCPETIVVDYERQPRLTDFDRAFIDRNLTVFPTTSQRRRNLAYVPPELADEASYDFETTSDMYSFGVLLFELLTNEVPFDGPEQAVAARGRPIALPSQLRVGVDASLDALVVALLAVDDFRARPSAREALATIAISLDGSSETAAEVGVAADLAADSGNPDRIIPGLTINGTLRVDAELGGGAFSRVFKVFHLDQQRTFAMKVLSPGADADLMLYEFREIGQHLPHHPNIAQIIWMDRLPVPFSTPYILSEYIQGETLEAYCDGRKRLAWSEIRSIGGKLLDALSELHGNPDRYERRARELSRRSLSPEEYEELAGLREAAENGFIHRDIKPANILLEIPSGEPKVIDFNIASRQSTAKGLAGTPRYWAPDRGQPRWRPDHDLFSLGVVLFELVTQRHPYADDRPGNGDPHDPRGICPDENLSQEVATFLLKTVQASGPDRFQSASAMKEALLSIRSMHSPAMVQPMPTDGARLPGITLEPWEIGRPNYNPYVTRILTLYSQARRTNAGTRGLDEIARFTYVQTRLDEKLTPAIADGLFRLLVVTGNAGDGKTAYLQRVEEYFRASGTLLRPLHGGNGSEWVHHGLSFQTNYDGSQDEGDLESDAVLARFLSPFSDDAPGGFAAKSVRLIAINEGRLLDFLDHGPDRSRFTRLRELLKRGLDGSDPPPGLLVVNLNLRSVAAGGRQSIVELQLERLLQDDIWRPCEACTLKSRCPLKHNADSLRDAAAGRGVRERVRRLFEVVHLRRRAHVTVRDLRSALSWFLLRDHGCDDIADLLQMLDNAPQDDQRRKARSDVVRLTYPAAFMATNEHPSKTVDDRVVRLLREADVGLVDEPRLDRRLDANPHGAVPWMAFDSRSPYAQQLLQAWADEGPRTLDEGTPTEILGARRRGMAMWRRWAYFERHDSGWKSMLPYRSLDLLERVVEAQTQAERGPAAQELRDKVVEAISLSEGLRHLPTRQHYLALRVSRVKNPTIRSFRLFPRADFTVRVAGGGRAAEYLEYAPDVVELVAAPRRGSANLRIPLDLLEMLELIRRGYRPSPTDLQGLFVNLVIFRNELLNLPFEKVLLTTDDDALFELSAIANASGAIHLALEPLAVAFNSPDRRTEAPI